MLTHRLLGGCSTSLSVSCPCLRSVLVAAARARLWSSFRWRSESPLLTLRKQRGKKKSLVSSADPDFFPDSLPASCGTLTPFRLCSRIQPQSSPWDPTEARASAPRPLPSRQVSRQVSRAGECWWAPILCAGISLLCPLHPCCCALLRDSEASPSATRSLSPRRGFLVCGNLSSFTAPSHWGRSCPYSFVSVFSFFFCPTQVRGEFLAFWEVLGLLPAFSWCSVGVVPHVVVFPMLFVGRKVISMSYSSSFLKLLLCNPLVCYLLFFPCCF